MVSRLASRRRADMQGQDHVQIVMYRRTGVNYAAPAELPCDDRFTHLVLRSSTHLRQRVSFSGRASVELGHGTASDDAPLEGDDTLVLLLMCCA